MSWLDDVGKVVTTSLESDQDREEGRVACPASVNEGSPLLTGWHVVDDAKEAGRLVIAVDPIKLNPARLVLQ
ncbi:hypothetical protein D3C85_1798260 [compost metagenome]